MKAFTTRFLTGLVIILIGTALLLSNLEVLYFDDIVSDWWPLAIILAGILVFINDMKSYGWSLLIVFVGVILQLQVLDIVEVNLWDLALPFVIIFIGASVIFNRSTVHKNVGKDNRDDIMAILAGSDKHNTSSDFRGSKVTAILGGVKLDLRKATIKKHATVEVLSFWGGVEIVVPKNIVIRNQTSAIMGGVEDKTDQENIKNSPVLYITGDVIMAGVEIKN